MDLFKLLGKIAIDTSEMEEAFEKARNDGKQAQENLESAFSKMGDAAITFGKFVVKGVAVGGAAVAGFVATAVNAYADYEQLVGGVETLFKDSASKVLEYANNAYKTAGMSANEYMETVTSFSASLLQSLDGDTAAAAEKADQAIVDMADNANKMGSTMESIQNAYQGFAKQNYTMLDNLKLGYGGTKEEMERLLEDAQAISGIEYDISSYADVVDAIHVIQTEMGITGTTAKEASSTISGSISSMKSSWENLLSGLAQGNADIPQLVSNVVSSGVTVLENIIPVAKQVLQNIPVAISEISPEAGAAVQTIIDICISAFDILKAAIVPTFEIIKNIFIFIQEHTGLITAVAVAIGVVTAAIAAYNAVQAVKAAMDAAEVTTLGALIAMKLASAAATLAAVAPYVLVAAAIAAVIAIGVALYKNWDTIKAKCIELGSKIKEKFGQIKESISNAVENAKQAALDKFNSLKTGAINKFNELKNGAVNKFNEIKSGIVNKINNAKDAVKNAIDKIKGFFNFKVSLPKIKLPHFSIKPKGWELGDLLEGSIPKLGIEWYAKAMNKPMIMNQPTVFGYNAATGKLQGGGEAGSEVVSGTNTLMKMISSAVATQNEAVVYYLQRLIQILAEYFPQVLEAMDRDVVLDSGETVGALAPKMDKALGKIAAQKERWA